MPQRRHVISFVFFAFLIHQSCSIDCPVNIDAFRGLAVTEDQVKSGRLFRNESCSNNEVQQQPRFIDLQIREQSPQTAQFILDNEKTLNISDYDLWSARNLSLEGLFVGFAFINVRSSAEVNETIVVRVLRPVSTQSQVFKYILPCVIVVANLGLGLTLDWKLILAVLKKPIAPLIGFCCQFIVMPLTAFAMVSIIKLEPSTLALGFLAMGCSPGGGASNYHAWLLGGDINLSVTMTVVSTIAALGMMPLWLLTLGPIVVHDEEVSITIPFLEIVKPLLFSIIPFGLAILFAYKFPKLAAKIFRFFVRPLMVIVILTMIIFGIWSNIYVFELLQPRYMIIGCVLPYVGFATGYTAGRIFQQGHAKSLTIAVETGIQNGNVAMVVLSMALPHPDSDLAIAGPLTVIIFTPIPLLIAEFARGIYLKCSAPPPPPDEDDEKTDKEMEEADGGEHIKSNPSTTTMTTIVPSSEDS